VASAFNTPETGFDLLQTFCTKYEGRAKLVCSVIGRTTRMDDAKALAARRWFGYGRWDAPYWFIGMEPGGADDHASYEAWRQLGGAELIDCREHNLRSKFFLWHRDRPKPQRTWIRLIQLLLGYERKPADLEAAKLYQRDRWGTLNGDAVLAELSALHAKDLDTPIDRNTYRSQRIATLRARLETFRPKFCVFYGVKYQNFYQTIAGTVLYPNGYSWCGSTLCALVQHPIGRNIPTEMKSGEWWANKGRLMGTITEGESHSVLTQSPATQLRDLHFRQPERRAQTLGENESHVRSAAETCAVLSDAIRLPRDENPKRVGSKSRLRFACYHDGITVAQYIDTVRRRLGNGEAEKCLRDLQWDSDPRRNLIRVERNGTPIALHRTASMTYGRVPRVN
jgi:hypothetical protein